MPTQYYCRTTRRQNEADAMHLLEVIMMLQTTKKYYIVKPGTEAEWLEATRNTAWRTEVTAARLLKARSQKPINRQ